MNHSTRRCSSCDEYYIFFLETLFIMDSLLFQTSPIYWIGNSYFSLIFSFLFSSIILWYIILRDRYINRSKYSQKEKRIFTVIDPVHPFYIEKTLSLLREYLQDTYRPHHATAHTARELSTYVENTSINSLIRELEEREYSGTKLSPEEKQIYNQKIQKELLFRA